MQLTSSTRLVDYPIDYLKARFWQAATRKGLTAVKECYPKSATLRDVLVDRLGDKVIGSVFDGPNYGYVFAEVDDCLLYAYTTTEILGVWLAGTTTQECEAAYTEHVVPLIIPPVTQDDQISVTFRYLTNNGPAYQIRRLTAPAWIDVESNYPSETRAQIEKLMSWRPQEDGGGGRIAVLHGPPGTGKTSALRALAQEWKHWCNVEYVVDPERFFGDAAYMVGVLLDDSANSNWRMVIIEDAEEYFTIDSKNRVGQGLSRLLNLGDGIIGQGLKVLLMMTTNVPLAEHHQAIIRPGRCFARIHLPPFTPGEATEWLARPCGTHMTLAEMYAAKTDGAQIKAGGDYVAKGTYL